MNFVMKNQWKYWLSLVVMGLVGQGVQADIAYVPNQSDDTLSVIDTTTNSIIKTLSVGSGPLGATVTSSGSRVYTANFGSNDVSVLDTSTGKIVATISVGAGPYVGPYAAVLNLTETRLYVTNRRSGGNSVSVIDTSTNSVIATIPVGITPVGIAINHAGTRVYVTNASSNTVSVIDAMTNKVINTIPVGIYPFGIVINPLDTIAYVLNQEGGNISSIDLNTNHVTTMILQGGNNLAGITGIAINSAGTRLYAVNVSNNNVSVVNTSNNSVVTTIPVGLFPVAAALSLDETSLYVVNSHSNTVSVIDTASNKVVSTITVGREPAAFGGKFIGSAKCVNPVTYDLATHSVAIPNIDIPSLSPLTGEPTSEVAVFSAKIQQMTGVDDFQIVSNSLIFQKMLPQANSSHALYEYNTGIFSKGGTVKMCVAVPNVVVIPLATQMTTPPKKYLVTLRQLAITPDTLHVESVEPIVP